ncbi:TPA: hypothetical protein IFD62_000110 [Escherichia coli]|uniref:Uncharacterized protein n=1 Tax=Escherichia phage SP27 TaxID=2495557 RepID=A0A5A4U7D2_9CAUD|nr:hypothetical protein [Escherichia coli]BBM61681.1 hypothetical protein EO157G_0920 [Escherichia phage SP27]HAN4697405.1 hypothetical protein [Escherichia coli]HAO2062052.1 hypothetical protein [Escherichia coli]
MPIPYVKIINNILDSWEDVITGKKKPSPVHALSGKLQFRMSNQTETFNNHDICITLKTPVSIVIKKNKDDELTLSIGRDKIILSNLSEEEFFQRSTIIDMKDFTYESLVELNTRFNDIQERLRPILRIEEEAWIESIRKMQEMLKENINNLGKATMEFGKTFKLNFSKDRK